MSVIIKKLEKKDNIELLVEKITREKIKNLSLDSKIIIKPNICSPKSPETGVTTHHEIIKGVLNALSNFKNILIVESNTTSSNFEINVEGWNSDFLKNYPNVKLINLSNEKKIVKNIKGLKKNYKVEFAQILDNYDYLIDLPVLKTHIHAKISIGIKNLFGLLSVKNKSMYHLDIHDLLLGILSEFNPNLTIVDAIQGLEGQGPIFGTPAEAGLILVGENVVEVDYVGSKIVGINPMSVKYLNLAIKNFLNIKVNDEQIQKFRLEKRFTTYPTLIYQVINVFNQKEKINLDFLLDNLDVPDQTKNNIPNLLDSLIKKGIILYDQNSKKYILKNIDNIVELFPETKSIVKNN
jgi:uncharacterized protein (DUF362 family)